MTAPTQSLSPADVALYQNRYPDVFKGSRLKRLAPLIGVVTVAIYFVYVWFFFSMGQVIERANWDIAGNYLADWISYESRPDIQLEDGYVVVEFPRFDALGNNPDPDWIVTETGMVEKQVPVAVEEKAGETGGQTSNFGFLGALPSQAEDQPAEDEKPGSSAFGFMGAGGSVGITDTPEVTEQVFETVREQAEISAEVVMGSARILIEPSLVTIIDRGQTLEFAIDRDESVTPLTDLPSWAEQKQEGGKVVVGLGFAGRVEVEDDEVKIRHRFLGWENFLFDANSPFFGKSMGEVIGLVFSGDRIDPEMSNAALAWSNIVSNAEWQHGDVWVKLLQTIIMAFIGTLFASILAFPLSFLAARNITPNRAGNWLMKRFFDFTRSVDMLIWALFFTRAFGPGPLAGISAIFVTDTGTFGKLYSEALENIDDKQREGVKSVGASPLLVQRFGVLPQVLPVFVSQSLYFWESNTRSATIIGAVGAGGIGLKLWEAMRTNQDWENVAYMVVLILIVVFVFDNVSNFLRHKLIGKQAR
ncbi:phosphonate ABC transporter, permease protein PhnE [Cucumibacter marinus]|uniref:phosphonate ABC transporter, permease protein PhnE n=1 Tax=Cucumibacter marinus TaxID=1121252 RepID=UPI000409E15F|nr:phosphonate ABC transporter, permease protein PhnE [Cucumibacter marinus]